LVWVEVALAQILEAAVNTPKNHHPCHAKSLSHARGGKPQSRHCDRTDGSSRVRDRAAPTSMNNLSCAHPENLCHSGDEGREASLASGACAWMDPRFHFAQDVLDEGPATEHSLVKCPPLATAAEPI
jgi:hypothetical protein